MVHQLGDFTFRRIIIILIENKFRLVVIALAWSQSLGNVATTAQIGYCSLCRSS